MESLSFRGRLAGRKGGRHSTRVVEPEDISAARHSRQKFLPASGTKGQVGAEATSVESTVRFGKEQQSLNIRDQKGPQAGSRTTLSVECWARLRTLPLKEGWSPGNTRPRTGTKNCAAVFFAK